MISSFRRSVLARGSIAVLVGLLTCTLPISAQLEQERKATKTVQPAYPTLARELKLTGTVKIELTIAPDGKVSKTRVLGGNPLLAVAAEEAVKQWKFEADAKETVKVLEFKFALP